RIPLVVTGLVAALLLPDWVHSANQTANSSAIEFGLDSESGNTPLGQPCHENNDCGHLARCYNSLCQCRNHFRPSNNRIDCAQGKVNDECRSDDECPASASCEDSKCSCGLGYLPSNDLSHCVKKKLNDSCTSDNQC